MTAGEKTIHPETSGLNKSKQLPATGSAVIESLLDYYFKVNPHVMNRCIRGLPIINGIQWCERRIPSATIVGAAYSVSRRYASSR